MPTVWAMRMPAGWGAMAPGSSEELVDSCCCIIEAHYGLFCNTVLLFVPKEKVETYIEGGLDLGVN